MTLCRDRATQLQQVAVRTLFDAHIRRSRRTNRRPKGETTNGHEAHVGDLRAEPCGRSPAPFPPTQPASHRDACAPSVAPPLGQTISVCIIIAYCTHSVQSASLPPPGPATFSSGWRSISRRQTVGPAAPPERAPVTATSIPPNQKPGKQESEPGALDFILMFVSRLCSHLLIIMRGTTKAPVRLVLQSWLAVTRL